MTIITKPISEKKGDKLIVPLVENDHLASAPNDVEAFNQDGTTVILRTRARRVFSQTTFLCLLIIALLVAGIGTFAGTYLYRQYLRAQIFKGWASIPYDTYEPMNAESAMSLNQELSDDDNIMRDLDSEINDKYSKFMKDFFNEGFELDLNNEDYEKIDVPDFRDGRSGRFIHDFNSNKTGIMDVTGKRCFVMPLNRERVLPPRSIFDLVQKMWGGYYKVDTEIVRETMRVLTPPVTDEKEIGSYISRECYGMPIYKLEKYVGGVVKRSADLHHEAKFAQFAGKGILEFDIMNFDELAEYEKKNQH